MLHELSGAPVMGVSLGGVSLLRLDQTGGLAPGNKSFKLRAFLDHARHLGITRLVSFGGAWSNHLHALAAVGHHAGIETVGIIRGEEHRVESPMLQDARRWGMRLVHVSRAEYRLRNDSDYQQRLTDAFGPCLLIPEGGADKLGASGCRAIAEMIRRDAGQTRQVVLPVGTGTTLAGVAAGLDDSYQLWGVSALKRAADLEQRVAALLAEVSPQGVHARWQILHDYHCGGFARTHAALREFIPAFEAIHGLQLEPVYTGKMLFAIHQLRDSLQWKVNTPVVAIHTGGLQGRRGYSWMH